MTEQEVQELLSYWMATAEHDYETMLALFDSKRYSDSLFFGHIVLEKVLKAHVVRYTKEQAPYTHNLMQLKGLIGDAQFTEGDVALLDEVNDFNIRGRYPDYKLQFYKRATLEYTEPYLTKIKHLYQKLCQQMTQKK